jgi:hypothetical protein
MNLDPTDILFIAFVLWLVVEILNNDDWGGGKRARVPV